MNQSQLIEIASADWSARNLSVPREQLLEGLEQGKVLYFPHLRFVIETAENALLNPGIADPLRKNISLAPDGSAFVGARANERTQAAARALVARYAQHAGMLVDGLFPQYRSKLRAAPTSLRLLQVETRQTSWRKDDSRLHIDAFPSRPNHGERILRVFTNVHPHGVPRVWRVGEPFEAVARRFLPRIAPPWPGAAWWLNALGITKTRRSTYDHLMLKLHDCMKADRAYQQDCPQQTVPFPPGSVWICFSDQASHAVMSGQFMLEQTFFLPVAALAQPASAPLGILERLQGRALV